VIKYFVHLLVKNRNKLKRSEFISSLPCTSRKFDTIIYMADPLLDGGSQDRTVTILTGLDDSGV
jgi:hypothetical protein